MISHTIASQMKTRGRAYFLYTRLFGAIDESCLYVHGQDAVHAVWQRTVVAVFRGDPGREEFRGGFILHMEELAEN